MKSLYKNERHERLGLGTGKGRQEQSEGCTDRPGEVRDGLRTAGRKGSGDLPTSVSGV